METVKNKIKIIITDDNLPFLEGFVGLKIKTTNKWSQTEILQNRINTLNSHQCYSWH